jgi:hypothetical protein
MLTNMAIKLKVRTISQDCCDNTATVQHLTRNSRGIRAERVSYDISAQKGQSEQDS